MKSPTLGRLWPWLLASALSLYSCKDDDEQNAVATRFPEQNISVLTGNISELDSFSRAISLFGPAFDVNGPNLRTQDGNAYTLFAPDNQAFRTVLRDLNVSSLADVDRALLSEVLKAHIARGTVMSTDLGKTTILPSLQGSRLRIATVPSGLLKIGLYYDDENLWKAGYAEFNNTDIPVTAKGVTLTVHIIDRVQIPKAQTAE